MSYHRRFLWTRIHRPALQTFILILLCLVCVFNLFLICSGSLSHTPNIEIASISSHASAEIESIDLDHTSEINNSETTERSKNIYEENETNKILQPASAPSDSTASFPEHSINSANAKSPREAEQMLKKMTEKDARKKTEESKAKIKGLSKDDELFVRMKEQEAKRGVHNVDTELDLTTVESVKEQQKATAKARASSGFQSDNPKDDYDGEDYEDDTEEIETIILNSDQPGIRQLPFCKETTDTAADESGNLTLARKGGLFDGKQLVVATLDGRISFLDQSGQLHWSFCTGSFFSSSMAGLQLTENGKLIRYIPSLTGGLYKFDGQSLHAMPATADSLLRKSFKMASSVVVTGGKEMKTFGLDLKSGNLKYECGMDGCKSSEDATVEASTEDTDDEDKVVLVVKKNLQTVRGIDPAAGYERWNFSVGTVELALAGITEGCYQGAAAPVEGTDHNHTALTKFFRMAIPEGMVFGADESNKVVWQHKFESPISQAWVFENGRLTVIDPMKCTPLMDEAPSLYIGSHKQQFYVQESQATQDKIRTTYELTDLYLESEAVIEMKRLEWKPTLTVALRDENTALSPIYDQPFFVYEREEVNHSATEQESGSTKEECKTDEPEDSPLMESGVILTIATLLFYWKEVLGISLLTALILLVPVVRIVRNRTTRQLLAYLRQRLPDIWHQEQQQEVTDRALVLYRNRNASETMSNSTLLTSLNSSTTFDRSVRARTRTTSSSSNHSYAEDQSVPFVSQYIKEFEPIQCLGRGGFGVVFEARKKIDDRCYAVKRIPLPNRAKSRDRVMREVKALAKLDHKNIVRYFNAWIENPPFGWLEKNDPLWNQCVVSSPSPTTDYPSEMGNEDSSLLSAFNNEVRKDYYEISLAGFTPDKERVEINDNDDSFIVFAASEDEQSLDGEQAATWAASAAPKNKSSTEVIDIPTHHHSSDKNTDERKERLWKLGDSNDSSICNESVEHSKFFVRPTTLDIPSTSSNRSQQNSNSTDNDSSESPLGIMYLYIQQELCQKRTLQEWLMLEKDRDLRQVTKMFIQIVEAVEYIHANRLIHRDLKPSNIFLAGGNGNSSSSITELDEAGVGVGIGDQSKEMTVKIGDFGLVTTSDVSKVPEENNCDPAGAGDVKSNAKLTGLVGTTLYMSYEQSQRKSYDHKVDIYSLGLILFEMIVPFATNMERYDLLSKVRALEIPQAFVKSYPDEYKLIRKMVSHNPTSRPEAAEIKYWLNQHLKALTSENNLVRSSSNWHRSKSAPSPDHQVAKILKAKSFI